MEHLQNLFILERLSLSSSNQRTSQKLFDLSSALLALTLMTWRYQERLTGVQIDQTFVALYYGAPASGILVLCLLEQTKSFSGINIPRRSETIQDLYAFVEILSRQKLPVTNAVLCHRSASIISAVLDRVLNFVPAPHISPWDSQTQANASVTPADPYPAAPNFEDFGSLGMLDTFDWADATFDDFFARLEQR